MKIFHPLLACREKVPRPTKWLFAPYFKHRHERRERGGKCIDSVHYYGPYLRLDVTRVRNVLGELVLNYSPRHYVVVLSLLFFFIRPGRLRERCLPTADELSAKKRERFVTTDQNPPPLTSSISLSSSHVEITAGRRMC